MAHAIRVTVAHGVSDTLWVTARGVRAYISPSRGGQGARAPLVVVEAWRRAHRLGVRGGCITTKAN